MKVKLLTKRIHLRTTADFKEYIEYFSNGDIEIAVYYPIEKVEPVFLNL